MELSKASGGGYRLREWRSEAGNVAVATLRQDLTAGKSRSGLLLRQETRAAKRVERTRARGTPGLEGLVPARLVHNTTLFAVFSSTTMLLWGNGHGRQKESISIDSKLTGLETRLKGDFQKGIKEWGERSTALSSRLVLQ